MENWEISFNLRAGDRSEHFQFTVNPVKEMMREFPSFPKDKFLRALESYSEHKQYTLHTGKISDLKFKRTSEYHDNQEIHVIMLVMEKIGPISLVFRKSFEYLVLEGFDTNYNYIGGEALLNVLIQIIKPDSPTVKGLGKIVTIYHASNVYELERKEAFVSFLDSMEGQSIVFALSIILPTIMIIVLPIQILDSMVGYLLSLGVLSILWCIYPISKRSTKYAPLSLVSAYVSYFIVEALIYFNIIAGGINPWGIFSDITRRNLIETLQHQEIITGLGREILFGIDLLQMIIPFFDVIIIGLIPFTVGVGLSGLFMISERKWKSATVLRTLFAALFLIAIIIIPLGYHAMGKGSEGTLHASIGLIETADMFSPKYLEDLDLNYEELLLLIASAQEHLAKAENSFRQFGENPLIAYILPYIMHDVSGIPLADLAEILTLTGVLADTIPYFPNILWGYFNLQTGLNKSFNILSHSISETSQGGIGASLSHVYNITMLEALNVMQRGANNLSQVENVILNLISEAQERLDYSVFAEISDILTEIEIGLPILIKVADNTIPWINSTYKLTLALDDVYEYDFQPDILTEAEKDYNDSMEMRSIDINTLSNDSLIPIRDLVDFSLNLHEVTRYYMFSVRNSSIMFQALNNTFFHIQSINFSDSSNILDPQWNNIDIGLQNTTDYLIDTEISLDNMSQTIDSQQFLDLDELSALNILLQNLREFTQSASDRIATVDLYVTALNGTTQSLRHFSWGSYNLNRTLSIRASGGLYDATNATTNFTQCQVVANRTYDNLTAVKGKLLNETAVEKWQHQVRADNPNDNSTSSIYRNAQLCLDLINIRLPPTPNPTEAANALPWLQAILKEMEDLDADWDIFS